MLNDNKITQMQDHVKQGNPFQFKLILITFCINNINFCRAASIEKKEFASTKDNFKVKIFSISWKLNQVTTFFLSLKNEEYTISTSLIFSCSIL